MKPEFPNVLYEVRVRYYDEQADAMVEATEFNHAFYANCPSCRSKSADFDHRIE